MKAGGKIQRVELSAIEPTIDGPTIDVLALLEKKFQCRPVVWITNEANSATYAGFGHSICDLLSGNSGAAVLSGEIVC